MSAIITRTSICCPRCGFTKDEEMPVDACVQRYRCVGCGRELERQAGTCCVFCSFGSVPCPPCQVDHGATDDARD